MQIEFDPDKDVINRAKHGLSLTLVSQMNFEAALIGPDERYNYGETRFQAMAPIAGRLHVLIYTMRGGTLRAISLRKANARERMRYDKGT